MGDVNGENSIDLADDIEGQGRDSGVTEVSPNETRPDLRKHADRDSRDSRDTSAVPRRVAWSAAELLATDFPEPRWAVPGLVAEGLTILAGPPKVGKSWLSLGLGIAISTGGKALGRIDVQQGPALYLALEDTPRRLKSRLQKITAGDVHPGLGELTITVECPPLPAGGDQRITAWLDRHPGARLVVIDVLSRIRGAASPDTTLYDRDYAAVARAKSIADAYGVAVVVVHHTRKIPGEDFVTEISGTFGISGAADAVISLKRMRGTADGVLYVTGRDVEESQHALSFSAELGAWQMLDTPVAEIGMGDTRIAVLHYVRDHAGTRPKEISDELGLDYELTKKTCARMVKDDQLDTDGKGRYFVPYAGDSVPVPAVPAVPAAGQGTFSQGQPEGQLSPPTCPDCGWRVDSVGHEVNCEATPGAYVRRPTRSVDAELDDLLDVQPPISEWEEHTP